MMKWLLLLAVSAAALVVTSVAPAAGEPTFTTNAYFNCRGDHGIGVPNGDRLILRVAYGAKNPGLLRDFLNDFQDFQVTIDGIPIADPMQYWGEPKPVGDLWVTAWTYDTGRVVTFGNPFWLEMTSAVARRLHDGVTREEDTSKPIFTEAGQSLIDTDGPCFVDAF
jgi:hypothetical protein